MFRQNVVLFGIAVLAGFVFLGLPAGVEAPTEPLLNDFQVTGSWDVVVETHDPPPFDEICETNPDDPWCDRGPKHIQQK
jgi:hypothetical protein